MKIEGAVTAMISEYPFNVVILAGFWLPSVVRENS